MIEAQKYTFDIAKMLFGEYSLMIYVEILLRVIIIMSYTVLVIKWIGKRVVGGLGSSDILLVIAMGSAVGDAMFYPSVPLSVAILVITTIATIQKIHVVLAVKFDSIRKKTHPAIVKLVEDGMLIKENFSKDKIDKNEVLMLLREAGVRYLSEVEHAYYEQSGKLSVFKYAHASHTHSILPEDVDDLDFLG